MRPGSIRALWKFSRLWKFPRLCEILCGIFCNPMEALGGQELKKASEVLSQKLFEVYGGYSEKSVRFY